MTIFADQFATMLGAKVNSVATCIGGDTPSELHLINGLFDCRRSYVPVPPVPVAEIDMDVAGDLT